MLFGPWVLLPGPALPVRDPAAVCQTLPGLLSSCGRKDRLGLHLLAGSAGAVR